jgi:hypothetical protein
MALPEQIRKQTEAVQELYKQIHSEPTTGEGNPAEEVDVSVMEQDAPHTADENSAPDTATQSTGNEQTPVDSSNEEDANSETFAQKWRTLQGMYNAEVPRLHSQNRDLQSRVQQMEQLLATMSAKPSSPTQQFSTEPLVTEKDVEDYGESIDVMRKVSREELMPLIQKLAGIEGVLQQLQTNVVPQVQNLTQRQALSADQQFWAGLTDAVPNWRDINNNQEFQSWLLEVDPLVGVTRQTILEDAQKSLDVRRVGNFFTAWLEVTGQANVAQNTRRKATASELERQVAPGRPRSAAAPTGNNAKTYAPSDIQKFFDEVRKGKYKGREAERDRIERDIFAAQRDGRIVANA